MPKNRDESKRNFQRDLQSDVQRKLQERRDKVRPGEKIRRVQQEIDEQIRLDKTEKDRYEDTEIKKRNFLDMLFDIFRSPKKKTEEKGEDVDIRVDRFDGMTLQDVIAPIDMEIDFNDLKIGDRYHRSFFVSEYPRFVGPNWLSPIINFEHSINISTFYYPVDTKDILQKLKRKIGELEATLYTQMEKRQVIDPSTKVALSDAQKLQDSIAEGSEKFFHYAMYISVSTKSKEELEKVSKNIISSLAAINVTAKTATLQQEDGFIACQPLGIDPIYITRNMDTTSLATTFPFVTSELTMDHGIMYGINQHNRSLVIFDRFDLENFNTVVFAKSGAGKSYFVKLEAIRSHMFGTNIIIIDPEHEYQRLSDAVNGAYISFSQDKGHKINPFELSGLGDPNDDELREKILSLEGFLRLLMGGKLTSVELAILDRALILTYREKGITLDPATQKNKKPPLLEDLYKVLKGMAEPEARAMAGKLERYIIGSAAGIFNEPSTVEITNPFIVFSVRDLQEELRPMGMYLILDFIWTRIRKDRKKRILLVDEAWYMMQAPDSAKFLYSMVKRARKYYLGVTTITQDVEDFLQNELGRAIINNSSLSFLMKQSPNAIDRVAKVFNLSEGEKSFLLSCDRGQGLFFAGRNHVAIQVISSKAEHEIITTAPEDLERIKREQETGATEKTLEELAEMYEPPVMLRSIKEKSEGSSEVAKAIKQRKGEVKELESDLREYEASQQNESSENTNAQKDVVNQMSDKYQELPSSISQKVVNERDNLGRGQTHLTPQGVVDDGQTDEN